jgi:hypothetical protein
MMDAQCKPVRTSKVVTGCMRATNMVVNKLKVCDSLTDCEGNPLITAAKGDYWETHFAGEINATGLDFIELVSLGSPERDVTLFSNLFQTYVVAKDCYLVSITVT